MIQIKIKENVSNFYRTMTIVTVYMCICALCMCWKYRAQVLLSIAVFFLFVFFFLFSIDWMKEDRNCALFNRTKHAFLFMMIFRAFLILSHRSRMCRNVNIHHFLLFVIIVELLAFLYICYCFCLWVFVFFFVYCCYHFWCAEHFWLLFQLFFHFVFNVSHTKHFQRLNCFRVCWWNIK